MKMKKQNRSCRRSSFQFTRATDRVSSREIL